MTRAALYTVIAVPTADSLTVFLLPFFGSLSSLEQI
jgi:hypothetical protein